MAEKTSRQPFQWDTNKEQAAVLTAAGTHTLDDIAAVCKVSQKTVVRWQKEPLFKLRVAEHVEVAKKAMQEATAAKAAELVYKYDITSKEDRLRLYQDMLNRHIQLVEARAEAHPTAPGGETGMVAETRKPTKYGEIVEYKFDNALQDSIRKYSELAAREKGQLSEKVEQTVTTNGPAEEARVVIEFKRTPPPTEDEEG